VKENREELDRILDEMAEETPEMPADFHARWTEQIRKEQQTQPRRERRRQLHYILSAAALFVFLIGGTLITRNLDKKNQADPVPAAQDKIMYSVEAGSAAANVNTLQAAEEPEEAEEAADMAVPMEAAAENMAYDMDAAVQEDAAYEAEEASAMDAAMAPAAAEKRAERPAEAAVEADTAVMGAAAMEEAMEAEEAAMPAKAAGAEAPMTEAPTAAPTEAPTEAPTAAPTEAPKKENAFLSFMGDFARFSLKALAVFAVIGVAAAAFIMFHRYWDKNVRKK